MNEKKTILIVDDLQINRTLFTEILRGEYDIITACDGQEALSVLEKRGEEINLALIDMKMPVMDGFTLLCAMRANEKLKEIPAIIITASDEEQNEIKALDKGATDYLSKPVQPQIMRKRISAAIDRVELEKIKCENRRLEDEEAHKKAMELVLENIDCGVALFESQNGKINISYVNDRVCEFIGKERDDYLKEMQRDIFTFVHPEDVFRIRAILDMNLPVGQEVKEPIRVIRQNGEYKWVMLSAKKSGEENGTIKYIATYKNADEEVKSREELRYRADHDELTGIYNKNAFIHATERYLKKFPDIEFVLIRMNIERFKVLNDVFGIAVGDGLLRTIADGLRSYIGKNGTFGRLERDHFAVCMPKSMLDFDKLSTLAERLWKIGGMEYVIVINFGIYEINNDDISVEQMCDRANLAISTIKGNYEKHYAYYDLSLIHI